MKSLLPKLLRESVYPVFFILVGKFISLVFVAEVRHFNYQRSLVLINFSSYGDFLAANSYSSLVVLLLIFVGILWSLTRAHFLHRTHITPALAGYLSNLRLTFLIQSTTAIYTQSLVWLVLLWLSVGDFILEASTARLYNWLPVAAAVGAFLTTWGFLLDWDTEIAWEKEGDTAVMIVDNINES